MKKIGILTFHYADNYGAVLQAYALRKIMNSLPNCKAEIINYIPEWFVYHPYKSDKHAKYLLEEKRRCVERFLMDECGICTPKISEVRGKDFDYYCVGSDQVWNLEIPIAKDLEYFLPHLDSDAVRIAYAASIGMEVEKINKSVFETYLPQFKKISLREGSYIEYINQICNVNCEEVLDPTLLLDKRDYESLLAQDKREEVPYILFFWYELDDSLMKGVEFANTLSRKYGISIIHSIMNAPSYMFCNNAGCMMYEGIEGFLWYVKHAKFVVTNSFHGSIFAIQFAIPFYIFISEIRRSRLDNLIKTLGIEERVVKGYVNPSEINDNIDFGSIRNKIEMGTKHSIDFLKEALDITK